MTSDMFKQYVYSVNTEVIHLNKIYKIIGVHFEKETFIIELSNGVQTAVDAKNCEIVTYEKNYE